MIVKFAEFEKKNNSTLQNTNFPTTYDCKLIEPTSIINPRIALANVNPIKYNYAHIPDFGRYYFVNNWDYVGGLWVATLDIDVLATYKAEIGGLNSYVLRSASEYDGNVFDTKYATTADVKHVSSIPLDGLFAWVDSNIKSGCFVVGIVGKYGAPGAGSVSYWAFTYDQMRYFLDTLMGNNSWMDDDGELFLEFSNSVMKSLCDPAQYISSCRWYPFSADLITGVNLDTISYGWYVLACPGKAITNLHTPGRDPNFLNVDIPKHPQSATRGAYLNFAPYSSYRLSFAPWGWIEIDPAQLIIDGALTLITDVDLTTGIAELKMQCGTLDASFANIAPHYAQLGIDMPITVTGGGAAKNVIGNTMGVAISAAGGNWIGAAQGAISALTDFVSPPVSNIGNVGGTWIGLDEAVELSAVFYMTTEDDNENMGRPLAKKRKISELAGFTMCAKTPVNFKCTQAERAQIETYLETGFYYE